MMSTSCLSDVTENYSLNVLFLISINVSWVQIETKTKSFRVIKNMLEGRIILRIILYKIIKKCVKSNFYKLLLGD